MASNNVSDNIPINSIPRVPSITELDGEESFVILGQSPSSFMFNEDGNQILQDALRSLNVNGSVVGDSPKDVFDISAKNSENGNLTKSANSGSVSLQKSVISNGTVCNDNFIHDE